VSNILELARRPFRRGLSEWTKLLKTGQKKNRADLNWVFWLVEKGRILAFWCASETGESSGMKGIHHVNYPFSM
jgi:hypothetical protein